MRHREVFEERSGRHVNPVQVIQRGQLRLDACGARYDYPHDRAALDAAPRDALATDASVHSTGRIADERIGIDEISGRIKRFIE